MKLGVFIPELLRHLFKKPATVDYPFKKLEVPPDFRGSPYLRPELCIACRACERDCPAEAIEITVTNEAEKSLIWLSIMTGAFTVPSVWIPVRPTPCRWITFMKFPIMTDII